jgi:ring-1,2-phenylacetyl-CoA epoxidase subunit PaaD
VVSVLELVAEVPDPELPFLTIEDLGILRSATVEGDVVHVVITPTYSGCPAMDTIRSDIEEVVSAEGLTADVEMVLSPAWTTDWISERGRQALADNGIAPPSAVRGPVLVALSGLRPTCPQCGSLDTEELSRFGSTACKGMWRCRTCREPFDHFKKH